MTAPAAVGGALPSSHDYHQPPKHDKHAISHHARNSEKFRAQFCSLDNHAQTNSPATATGVPDQQPRVILARHNPSSPCPKLCLHVAPSLNAVVRRYAFAGFCAPVQTSSVACSDNTPRWHLRQTVACRPLHIPTYESPGTYPSANAQQPCAAAARPAVLAYTRNAQRKTHFSGRGHGPAAASPAAQWRQRPPAAVPPRW